MGNGVFFLLLFVPIGNIIILIMQSIRLSRAFGRGSGFAVGLFFLQPIFCIILGFGEAQYIGPNGIPRYPGAYGQQR
jgi:hypothetical protein